jgi:hypothetical protein
MDLSSDDMKPRTQAAQSACWRRRGLHILNGDLHVHILCANLCLVRFLGLLSFVYITFCDYLFMAYLMILSAAQIL